MGAPARGPAGVRDPPRDRTTHPEGPRGADGARTGVRAGAARPTSDLLRGSVARVLQSGSEGNRHDRPCEGAERNLLPRALVRRHAPPMQLRAPERLLG